MNTSLPIRKILWAVDAFEGTDQAQCNAAEAVKALQDLTRAQVYPVHILSPAELNLSADFAGPWVAEYLPAARKALEHLLKDFPEVKTEPAQVLLQSALSTAQATETLVEHALGLGADLIVVGTHGRKGIRRLLLGSFAETLIARSRVPVMVIGPNQRAGNSFKKVLVPTEFGSAAKNVFRHVVSLAKELDAETTLFHAVMGPVEPSYQSGVYLLGSPWMPVFEDHTKELARHERHAQSWAHWARNQGVKTSVMIDKDMNHIAEAIVRHAREQRVGWIAMGAHSGPVASAFLGSVSRQVIRMAECPVWVMRWPRVVQVEKKEIRAA